MSSNPPETLGPEWLAFRFDETNDTIRFVDYDRDTRASTAFLAVNYLPEKPYRAEPRERAKLLAPSTAPIHFIFHSGFCCSTLFARCFDRPGLASAFSEPNIFNDIVGWRWRGPSPSEVGRALDDALSLLARPFTGDQAALVKPSTIANGLSAAMMKMRPEARAIVMYAPLEDHLVSLAKKGFDGRRWGRELFLGMRKERLLEHIKLTDLEFLGLMDLQIAACSWLGQQQVFAELIQAYPDRVRSLCSSDFLARPEKAIQSAAHLFDLSMSAEQLRSVKEDVLTRNSKEGTSFSRGAREAEYRSARATYGDEVEKISKWAALVIEASGIPTELPASLV